MDDGSRLRPSRFRGVAIAARVHVRGAQWFSVSRVLADTRTQRVLVLAAASREREGGSSPRENGAREQPRRGGGRGLV